MRRHLSIALAGLILAAPIAANAVTTINGTITETIAIVVKTSIPPGGQIWCVLQINGNGPQEMATVQAARSGIGYSCNPTIHYAWVASSVPSALAGSFTVYLVDTSNEIPVSTVPLNLRRSTTQLIGQFSPPANGGTRALTAAAGL
jgi:hypothetical protein